MSNRLEIRETTPSWRIRGVNHLRWDNKTQRKKNHTKKKNPTTIWQLQNPAANQEAVRLTSGLRSSPQLLLQRSALSFISATAFWQLPSKNKQNKQTKKKAALRYPTLKSSDKQRRVQHFHIIRKCSPAQAPPPQFLSERTWINTRRREWEQMGKEGENNRLWAAKFACWNGS